jgi:hypothetical protein
MGISLSSTKLTAWFKQISTHSYRGVVKSSKDGSVLSLDSDSANTSESMSDLSPRSRRVVSFTPVYSHAGRERS